MGRYKYIWLILILAAVLAPVMVTSCADDGAADSSEEGRLALPLSGVSESGVTYRLVEGTFIISGTAGSISVSSDDYLGLSVAEIDLEPGDYSVVLLDGWTLERLGDAGFVPVEATLTSTNPVAFTTDSGATSPVVFLFVAGDEIVSIGDGSLSISIEVTEESACVCPSGQLNCGGICSNVKWDANNCGTCGKKCGTGHWCNNGTCN